MEKQSAFPLIKTSTIALLKSGEEERNPEVREVAALPSCGVCRFKVKRTGLLLRFSGFI